MPGNAALAKNTTIARAGHRWSSIKYLAKLDVINQELHSSPEVRKAVLFVSRFPTVCFSDSKVRKATIMSKIFSICLFVICFATATSSPVMGAPLIDNGDFETLKISSGHFTEWWYGGTTTDEVTSSPSVISGDHSARMTANKLSQTFNESVSDFTLEFDFAILDTAGRSLSMYTDNSIANLKVDSGAFWVWYMYPSGASSWHSTGLVASTTPDIGSDGDWDDGEVPVVNHLTLTGTGYGTASASATLTLTGGASDGTYSTWVLPSAAQSSEYAKIIFDGDLATVDFLIDNVSCVVNTFPGDANYDMTVNADDAAILAANWLGTGKEWGDGDFNGDGIVNDKDAALMASNWLWSKNTAAAVPEPCCMMLLLTLFTAMCGMAFLRRT